MSTGTESSEIDLAAEAAKLALGAGASEADAWLRLSREGSFIVREGDVEQALEARSTMLALRVFAGQRVATVSSTDLSLAALQGLAAQAVELAKLSNPNPYAGLPDAPAMTGEVGAELDLYDRELFEQTSESLIALAQRAQAAGLGFDPRITKSDGAIIFRRHATIALANSRGFAAAYQETSCSLSVTVIAVDPNNANEPMRDGGWSTSDRHFARMEAPEQVGQRAAERALRQFGARRVPTQEAPVVWSPPMAALLIEFLTYGTSGEVFNQGSTFLIGQEGRAVGSPLFTLTDDPTLPGGLGTRPFDDEGVAPRRTPLFESGIFRGFLFDSEQARRAGRASTGHAIRSWRGSGWALGIQSSNLSLTAGKMSPDAIIEDTLRGLYLTELIGLSFNQTTGDFSAGGVGIWIEQGRLSYPVAEVNVAGRLPQMLHDLDAVGNDPLRIERITAPTLRISRMTISGR